MGADTPKIERERKNKNNRIQANYVQGFQGQQQYAPPQQYSQQPPQYGAPPVQGGGSEKMGFDQTFQVERPKYNDLWAAILFILTFGGFVAVSGLAIHGYASQGSGAIYDSNNTVSLNSNTIILLWVWKRYQEEGYADEIQCIRSLCCVRNFCRILLDHSSFHEAVRSLRTSSPLLLMSAGPSGLQVSCKLSSASVRLSSTLFVTGTAPQLSTPFSLSSTSYASSPGSRESPSRF